jgi:uncharacterized coiled-coil DUF342 family protein
MIIMPPSNQDMTNALELLKVVSDPKETRKALEQLRDRINELHSELETARAAQRDAADVEQRAQKTLRELEKKSEQLASLEKSPGGAGSERRHARGALGEGREGKSRHCAARERFG